MAVWPLLLMGVTFVALHGFGHSLFADPWLVAVWVLVLGFVIVQFVLAWRQRPFGADAGQTAELNRLYVTVSVPCYNEDVAIVDRTLYSLFRQSRLPDHVFVVDDGSSVDYGELQAYWERSCPPSVRFTWVRQENAGKKHAQSVCFLADTKADIFVTIDSDSALDQRAIEEGLKPFVDPGIMSVAGLETAFNFRKNLLTRAIGARSIAFQLFAMSAQSAAGGNVLINPGAFSLYRAGLIRDIVPAYLGETFCGHPVILGDDTALTLFALCRGRAVHQPTAVSLPVYPETLSHHLRQWTRWMRASTIRTFWRLRYLSPRSYGFLYAAFTVWAFFNSVALTLLIPIAWPASRNLLLAGAVALCAWPLAMSFRLATISRSDERRLDRTFAILLLPLASLWYLVVLRQIRYYGIATCARQHWVTREKVEVTIENPSTELVRPKVSAR